MRNRKNFRKKPRGKQLEGLQVDVYNNNVDKALRILKKKWDLLHLNKNIFITNLIYKAKIIPIG